MKRALPAVAFAALVLAGCASTDNGRTVNNKDAAHANVQLGVAYIQQGKLAWAKEKLDRAAKQDPTNPEVYWAQAALHEQLDQPKEAERAYQTAMRLAPQNTQIVNTYAAFLCKRGEVDKALPLFEKVIADRLFPQPWAAATNAGVCLRTDKRGAEAAPWLQRAITLRPDYVPAVVELGDLQISQGKPEEARATVDRFLGIGRKSADVLLVGVRAAMAQGNRAGAETYARQLRRDFSNSPQERVLPQLLSGQGNAATP